jgi:hypothetical protein
MTTTGKIKITLVTSLFLLLTACIPYPPIYPGGYYRDGYRGGGGGHHHHHDYGGGHYRGGHGGGWRH